MEIFIIICCLIIFMAYLLCPKISIDFEDKWDPCYCPECGGRAVSANIDETKCIVECKRCGSFECLMGRFILSQEKWYQKHKNI